MFDQETLQSIQTYKKALRRAMESEKQAARDRLESVQALEDLIIDIETNDLFNPSPRREPPAAAATEPQPEPAAKVDQADQAPPAAEPQEAAAELQPAPQPELPADPRARRKAGIA